MLLPPLAALLLSLAAPAGAAEPPVNGIFTALWFSKAERVAHEAQFGPWLYHSYYEDEQSLHSVEYWKKEVKDMERAKFDFVAPYSFGKDVSPGSDPANFGALARAIHESGSPLKMAYFHDNGGPPIQVSQETGVHEPFDLSKGEAHWRKYVYEGTVQRFFKTIPRDTWYRYRGRPLMFFYTANPAFVGHREHLGALLGKIREWFRHDYAESPFIVVDVDWLDGQTPTAKTAIQSLSDGFFSWSFMAPGGQGPFPGGGVTRRHTRTGVTVGMAGVGYSYKDPAHGARYRDRANGQTLMNDWNRIRGANIRMVAAWFDLEEASGICRTKEYDYQYIDIMRKLICPSCEIPACDPETQPAPHWGTKNGQCLKSCGASGGTQSFADACENHGMASAGPTFEPGHCCR